MSYGYKSKHGMWLYTWNSKLIVVGLTFTIEDWYPSHVCGEKSGPLQDTKYGEELEQKESYQIFNEKNLN